MRVFSVWAPRRASQLDEVLRRHPKANGLFDGVIWQNARRRRIAARWAEPWDNILGQPNFSASQSKKHWNQSQSAKFPFRQATQGYL
jgi:hypothetical protein